MNKESNYFINPTTGEKMIYLASEAVDAKESYLKKDYEMTLIHLKEADEWCQEAIQDVKKEVNAK